LRSLCAMGLASGHPTRDLTPHPLPGPATRRPGPHHQAAQEPPGARRPSQGAATQRQGHMLYTCRCHGGAMGNSLSASGPTFPSHGTRWAARAQGQQATVSFEGAPLRGAFANLCDQTYLPPFRFCLWNRLPVCRKRAPSRGVRGEPGASIVDATYAARRAAAAGALPRPPPTTHAASFQARSRPTPEVWARLTCELRERSDLPFALLAHHHAPLAALLPALRAAARLLLPVIAVRIHRFGGGAAAAPARRRGLGLCDALHLLLRQRDRRRLHALAQRLHALLFGGLLPCRRHLTGRRAQVAWLAVSGRQGRGRAARMAPVSTGPRPACAGGAPYLLTPHGTQCLLAVAARALCHADRCRRRVRAGPGRRRRRCSAGGGSTAPALPGDARLTGV
jgi:hypothetical protein